MRMWMVDPKILCNIHLKSEHYELHTFIGSIKKKRNLRGYIDNNLVEIFSLFDRHDILVKEMKERNINHKSEILKDFKIFSYLNRNDIIRKIDIQKSKENLLDRCKECKRRHEELCVL